MPKSIHLFHIPTLLLTLLVTTPCHAAVAKTPEEKDLLAAAEQGNLHKVNISINTSQTDKTKIKHLNIVDHIQRTAMHLATEQGHVDVVKALIQAGANTLSTDGLQNTPLHLAAARGHIGIVNALINKAKQTNKLEQLLCAQNLFDDTPLHLAATKGYVDVVKALITPAKQQNKLKKHLETPNQCTGTPLHCAAKEGEHEVVKILIQEGAYIQAKDSSERTAMHLAAENGHVAVFNELVIAAKQQNNLQTLLDSKDYYDNYPLHLAAEKGHEYMVEAIMQQAQQPNQLKKWLDSGDAEKNTPLHLSAMSWNVNVAKQLVKAGANKNLLNQANQTPRQLAQEAQRQDILNFLAGKKVHLPGPNTNPTTTTPQQDNNNNNNLIIAFLCLGIILAFVYTKKKDNTTDPKQKHKNTNASQKPNARKKQHQPTPTEDDPIQPKTLEHTLK